MVVAGAPEVCDDHAARILDMAFDMVDSIVDLRDPSTGGSMKIRIGKSWGKMTKFSLLSFMSLNPNNNKTNKKNTL